MLSWKHPCFQLSLSSRLVFLWVPSVIDVILSWHLSALPSCLPVPSPSLWGGTVCFWRFVYGGRNILLLQADSSLSAHHTEHDSPPSLWCWDELFLMSPWGVKIFCFSLSSLNLTSDGRSILCAPENSACFGPCTQTLCNLTAMWFEVMYLFNPRVINVLFYWMQRFIIVSIFPTQRTWMQIQCFLNQTALWEVYRPPRR